MKQLAFWLLFLAAAGTGRAARAQFSPWMYYGHSSGRPDTAAITEHRNPVAFLVGPALLVGQNGLVHGGGYLEVGRALSPRLTASGYLLAGFNQATNNAYGTGATAPALGRYTLAGSLRYQLLNTRRWRLEALGSLGATEIVLVDRDQQVPGRGRYANTTHATIVGDDTHPVLEAGASTSYKLTRQLWLTSRLSYNYLALGSSLSEPGEFSYWLASVGIALPWGRH